MRKTVNQLHNDNTSTNLTLCKVYNSLCKKPRSASPQLGVTRAAKKEKKKETPTEQEDDSLSGGKGIKNEPTEKPDMAPNQRLLSAMFQQLPLGGQWTSSRRQRWITAMTATVDLMVEVTADDSAKAVDVKPEVQDQHG